MNKPWNVWATVMLAFFAGTHLPREQWWWFWPEVIFAGLGAASIATDLTTEDGS